MVSEPETPEVVFWCYIIQSRSLLCTTGNLVQAYHVQCSAFFLCFTLRNILTYIRQLNYQIHRNCHHQNVILLEQGLPVPRGPKVARQTSGYGPRPLNKEK